MIILIVLSFCFSDQPYKQNNRAAVKTEVCIIYGIIVSMIRTDAGDRQLVHQSAAKDRHYVAVITVNNLPVGPQNDRLIFNVAFDYI